MRPFTAAPQLSSALARVARSIKRPLICLSLSLSILSGAWVSSALAGDAQTALANPNLVNAPLLLADGVYLYGESSQANQLGTTYIIFEVMGQRVKGAFYMPSSSFDCFHGQVHPGRLALMVVNSYEDTTYPYALVVQEGAPLVASEEAIAPVVGLVGYQPIATPSPEDYQILETCQANLREI